MATHATAYRDSGPEKSENLSRHEIRELVLYSALPLGAQRLILASLKIGDMGAPQVWCSVKSLSFETRKAERTVQYHRRRLRVALGVARVVRPANTWDACPKCSTSRDTKLCPKCGYEGIREKEFRRGATYEFDLAKIASFQPCPAVRKYRNYKQYSESRKKRPQHEVPARPQPPAPAQPVPIRPAAEAKPVTANVHRSSEREPNRRERQEMATKIAQVRSFMRGRTEYRPPEGGMMRKLEPDDESYIAPMTLEAAIKEACMEHPVVPESKLREWLKMLPRSLEES
jgi:hypothetical protein